MSAGLSTNTLATAEPLLVAVAGILALVILGLIAMAIMVRKRSRPADDVVTQPVRLGDRITVGDTTGTAHEITLFHTVLVTDDGKRAFVPNSQLTTSIITNRSIDEPTRTTAVRLPIKLGVPVEEARRVLLEALEGTGLSGAAVTVDDVTDSVAWLKVSVTVAETAPVGPELRERGLGALAREQLLPGT